MKKAVSTAMALSMMVGLMGVNASAYEAGSYDGVSITMLNTKSELGNGIRKEAKKLHLFYMMMVHVKYLESTEQGHGVL